MLIYHFVDPDLGLGIFFEKKWAIGKWDIDFERGN